VRFTVRWAVAAVILAAIMVVLAAVERREHLRSQIAIVRAETAYRDAKLARELADVAVKEYAEGTFPRERASADDEIKQAEDRLNRIRTPTTWAERIRSKGYLLLIDDVWLKELAVRKAAFDLEQAKSKKHLLAVYTKFKTLEKLNKLIAKAREDELAKQAAYDRVRATPVGFIRNLIRRK